MTNINIFKNEIVNYKSPWGIHPWLINIMESYNSEAFLYMESTFIHKLDQK